MTIWIVGLFRGSYEEGSIWSLIGIFQNKKQADMRCRTTEHFMAPFMLNSSIDDAPSAWQDLRYPRREEIKSLNVEEVGDGT